MADSADGVFSYKMREPLMEAIKALEERGVFLVKLIEPPCTERYAKRNKSFKEENKPAIILWIYSSRNCKSTVRSASVNI